MDEERVFRGTKMQRGYGLGGFFAKLWRSARPLLRKGGEYIGKKAIRTGLHTIQDIAAGNNPRTALKRRVADVSDEMLDDVKRKIRRKMSGQGRGIKKIVIKKKTKRKKPLKKKCIDVFAI